MHELPDEYLADVMPVAKKVAIATGATEYNILQNNGRLAHQVRHTTLTTGRRPCALYVLPLTPVHVIPKPSQEQGLIVGWPSTSPSKEELNQVGGQAHRRSMRSSRAACRRIIFISLAKRNYNGTLQGWCGEAHAAAAAAEPC